MRIPSLSVEEATVFPSRSATDLTLSPTIHGMSGLSPASLIPLQLSVDPIWFVAVAVVVFGLGAVVAPLLAATPLW